MQEDNLHRNLPKENASSMIFHLFNRHDLTASTYRQIAADLNEEMNLKSWFSSLAEFRQSLADELRQMVQDNGEVPVTPSEEMKPFLHKREDEITQLINEENAVGLIDLSMQAEESVAKYYQKVEANKDIPQQIREKLSKQHGRLLEVVRKAQRLHAVPEQEDASFKV